MSRKEIRTIKKQHKIFTHKPKKAEPVAQPQPRLIPLIIWRMFRRGLPPKWGQ